MHVRKFVLLGVVLWAGSLWAVAQSDATHKDQPQNQSTGATSPDAKTPSGGTSMETSSAAQSDRGLSQKALDRLYREVRHELVMLPNLSLWDNLAYKIDGRKVTLLGQVRTASLKSEAEKAVKSIEGVEEVDNQIEVLPPSPNDDRIRRAVARAIFDAPGLFPYAVQSIPPIHIIVKGGNVTLEGVVNNTADRNMAEIKTKQVPGVFSVTNHLQVVSDSKK